MTNLSILKHASSSTHRTFRFWLWLVSGFAVLWGAGIGLMYIADSTEHMLAVGLAYVMVIVIVIAVVLAIMIDKNLCRLL